jgi:hypothetical protein
VKKGVGAAYSTLRMGKGEGGEEGKRGRLGTHTILRMSASLRGELKKGRCSILVMEGQHRKRERPFSFHGRRKKRKV